MKRRLRLTAILAIVMTTLSGFNLFAANIDDDPFFESTDARDSVSLKGRPIYFDDERFINWDGQVDTGGHLPSDGRLMYHYLGNRRALTGESCNINKLVNTVTVGSWTKELGNILDDDLNNYGEVNAVVNADVTVGPVLSIRDKSCYYAKGTEAGFCIVAGSTGSTVLDLSVIQAMAIGFYRDGKLVGTVAVKDGQNAGGINLSLVNIPGSDDTGFNIVAEAPGAFDEISLDLAGGIQANVGRLIRIKYGFVGKPSEEKIKRTCEDGIVLDYIKGYNPVLLGIPFPMAQFEYDNFFSDDPSKGANLTPVVGLAFMGSLEYVMKDSADPVREVYEPGMDLTFNYTVKGGLSLGLGSTIQISLLDRNGKTVQQSTVEAGVLNLDVVNVGAQTVSITSDVPFSGAKLAFYGGLQVNVSGITITGSTVRDKSEIRHHCPINPTGDMGVCADQTSFQLRSNPQISVTWELMSQPEGGHAQVTPDGKVTGMDVPGSYEFRAVAADGCEDYTVLTLWDKEIIAAQQPTCGIPLVNTAEEPAIYEVGRVSTGVTGGLIPINQIKDAGNIVDGNNDTYATYGGINVANNVPIVGVIRTDGKNIYDGNAEPGVKKRIGFLVSSPAEILNLKALEFIQVRCYYKGVEVYRHVIDESNAVSADVGGANANQKVRYSIAVPDVYTDERIEGGANDGYMHIDAIELWTSGVLSIEDDLFIYNAFIEDNDANCNSPFGCQTELLGFRDNHTTLNFNGMDNGQGLSVASGINNMDCLVDGDLDTYCTVFNTVNAAGVVFDINLGRTYDFRQKLGLVMDSKTFTAGVGVGGWLTLETYYNGMPTGEKYTDWNLVDANVAGYGDKRVIFVNPQSPYDEVKLTIANVLSALSEDSKYYGFGVLSDIDNDGLADCRDAESCNSDIHDTTVGDVCQGDIIDITAKGLPGTDYYVTFGTPDEIVTVEKTDENGNVITETYRKKTLCRTDNQGNLAVSHKTTEAGMFSLTFYDGSQKPIHTDPYTVHPTETTWKRNASNSDWKKWDNWTNGSPYCCTNVVIPSDATIYPDLSGVLSKGDDYCCQNIHFAPRAEVGGVQNLNYSKAWTELELTPNSYNLLSAPLKAMVTGDIFVPAAMQGVHSGDYFSELDAAAAPQNRFNPSIYQRRWYAAVQDRNWGDRYTDLEEMETIEGMTTTSWSKNFNMLNYAYGMGEGFSLWVDNGNLPEATAFRFRFPKAHTTYDYFNDFTGEVIEGVNETISRSEDNKGRFIYEDAAKMEATSFKASSGGHDYDRTVFNGAADMTVTVKPGKDEETDIFVFGNPFMSSINVEALIEANKDKISGVTLYDGNTTATARRSANGAYAKTADVNAIAPMQGAFIIANGKMKSLDLKITPEMLVSAKKASEPEGETPDILRIRLRDSEHEAAVLVAEGDNSLCNLALLDNEVAPSLAVIAIESGMGRDITAATDRIPLAVIKPAETTAYLDFSVSGDFSAEDYKLMDMATDKEYELNEIVTLPAGMASSAGRFVIVSKHGVSTIVDINNDDDNRVFVEVVNGDLRVKSTGDELTDVVVADINGMTVAERHGINADEAVLSAGRGIRIVSVMTAGRKSAVVFKINVI